MNEAEYAALRTFERDRWARQAEVLRAWRVALPPCAPCGNALRRAIAGERMPNAALAQMHFDLARDAGGLQRALEGKTPTAVDRTVDYGSKPAFARHEAAHTADNALTFLRKIDGDHPVAPPVERAQRWIQRLRWELVDTDVQAEVPTAFSAQVLADPAAVRHRAAATIEVLTHLRAALVP